MPKASIGNTSPVGAFGVFLWLKIWSIKKFCLFLPVVTTNQGCIGYQSSMKWKDQRYGRKVIALSQDGVTLRSGRRGFMAKGYSN